MVDKHHRTIHNIDTWEKLRMWKRSLFRLKRSDTPITLNLSELSEEENTELTESLNHYNQECGCGIGSMFMLVAFLIGVISYFTLGGTVSWLTVRHGIELFLFMVGASLLGKVIGLMYARYEMIRIAEIITHRVENWESSSRVLFF